MKRLLLAVALVALAGVPARAGSGRWPASSGGGGGGTVTSIAPGTGISVTGTASVPIVTNTAPFGPDVSVLLNNSSSSPVTAGEFITDLTTNTAGAEVSRFRLLLLNAGAQFTALSLNGNAFIGVNTTTTNISGYVAGSAGATFKSVGNGTAAVLELASGNASATQANIAAIDVYNGATRGARLVWDNLAGTTAAELSIVEGAQTYVFNSVGMTVNGTALFNSTIQLAGAATFNASITAFNFAGNHFLSATNGALYVQTGDANDLNLRTNGTLRVSITSTGNEGFFGATAVAQQTVGANVNNVVASGTTGRFDDFTSLTVYTTDAAAIHADIYQLARSVAQLTVAVRNLGFGN